MCMVISTFSINIYIYNFKTYNIFLSTQHIIYSVAQLEENTS